MSDIPEPRRLKNGWRILPGSYVYNKKKRKMNHPPYLGQVLWVDNQKCRVTSKENDNCYSATSYKYYNHTYGIKRFYPDKMFYCTGIAVMSQELRELMYDELIEVTSDSLIKELPVKIIDENLY